MAGSIAAEDVETVVDALVAPSPLPTPVTKKADDSMNRYAIEEHELGEGAVERDDEWCAALLFGDELLQVETQRVARPGTRQKLSICRIRSSTLRRLFSPQSAGSGGGPVFTPDELEKSLIGESPRDTRRDAFEARLAKFGGNEAQVRTAQVRTKKDLVLLVRDTPAPSNVDLRERCLSRSSLNRLRLSTRAQNGEPDSGSRTPVGPGKQSLAGASRRCAQAFHARQCEYRPSAVSLCNW